MKILKIVFPLVLISFLVLNIVGNWGQIVLNWHNFQSIYVFFAFLFLLIVYPEAAFSWYILLAKMGVKCKLRNVLYVWIVANTSRYIPGTVWQFIGRIGLAERIARVSKKDSGISLLWEIFFGLAGASLISLLSFPVWNLVKVEYIWIIVLAPLILLGFHPSVLTRIIRLIAYALKRDLGTFSFSLGFLDSLLMTFLSMSNFILNGIAIFLLLKAINISMRLEMIAVLSAFYALSWIIGYISVFAPGGIGVTEISLAYLLSGFMPFSSASLVALFYRFLLTMAEILVFLFVYRFVRV